MNELERVSMRDEYDLSGNALKNIALILMFLDHAVSGFMPHESIVTVLLHIPGRVVAPIMCYFIAEGHNKTSDTKKYIARLLVLSVVSHFPYVIYFGYEWWQATSVIWGLCLGLIALTAVKNETYPLWLKVGIVGLCCLLAVPANWNYISVLWIVAFGVFRGQFKLQIISFLLIGIGLYAIPVLWNMGDHHIYQFGIVLAIPLLALYKGRRGVHTALTKWGFYIFYPTHLVFLYLLL